MRRMFLMLVGCLTASPAMASQPSPESQPAQTGAEASPAPPASEDDNQTALANNIESRIANGWGKYDAVGSGFLGPAEFSTWMNDLRAENGNGPADNVIMRRAFLVADADKDTKISRDELTSFMMLRNKVKASAGR